MIRQYPQHADTLRAILPTLEAVAGLSRSVVGNCDGADRAAVSSPFPDDSIISHGILGDYRILRELGRGGMGVVYEAEQISLGRHVALKVLPFAAMLDSRQIERFKIEARAAATLDHPGIVSVYSVGSERGVCLRDATRRQPEPV